MITKQKKYLTWLKKELQDFGKDKDIQIFIFGSSARNTHFNDIDIAVKGKITDEEIRDLKENFEESCFPYFVDIVNLNTASSSFTENIFKQPKLWIKR